MTYRTPRYDHEDDGAIEADTTQFGGSVPGWYASKDDLDQVGGNHGFEIGETGKGIQPTGWEFIQYSNNDSQSAVFKNESAPNSDGSKSYGTTGHTHPLTGVSMGAWSVRKWFSPGAVSEDISTNVWAKINAQGLPDDTSFITGEETLTAEDDVFIEVHFYNGSHNEISVSASETYSTTASHQSWQDNGTPNSGWVECNHTVTIPSSTSYFSIEIVNTDKNNTITNLGVKSGNSGCLIDDFEISTPTGLSEIQRPKTEDYLDFDVATPNQLFSKSYNDLTNVPNRFPPENHNHGAGDLTFNPATQSDLDSLFPVGNSGEAQQSGDGQTTTFTIPHGLGAKPAHADVTAKSEDASVDFYIEYDDTNITVHYAAAPAQGTNNLTFDWVAFDQSLF